MNPKTAAKLVQLPLSVVLCKSFLLKQSAPAVPNNNPNKALPMSTFPVLSYISFPATQKQDGCVIGVITGDVIRFLTRYSAAICFLNISTLLERHSLF